MNYYQKVLGNLNTGDIAKAEDIHHIQQNIQDALKALLSDLHNRESYILGTDEECRNSFILKAAPKRFGRYIDSYNDEFEDDTVTLNFNNAEIKQPILMTKTSLYSIVTKFKNDSDRSIDVTCKIVDEFDQPKKNNTVTLAPNTTGLYEIVFDIDFYPTHPNLNFEDLAKRDGKDIPPNIDESSFDEGYDESHDESIPEREVMSAGVSKLFFVIEPPRLSQAILSEQNNNETVSFNAETSLGVVFKEGSLFPDKDVFAYQRFDKSNYTATNGNIFYRCIYANEMTYLCSGGMAIIGGEKVRCLDTHISLNTGNELGNVLTQVYLDNKGHLQSANKKASFTTNIDEFIEDEDDLLPPAYLPIGLILTYSSLQYGTNKEPLIIQDDYNQSPKSHHERLRRLEKRIKWDEDITLPARIKKTISDGEWVDYNSEYLSLIPNTTANENGETTKKDNVFTTTDENGNIVVKLSNAVSHTIPITLKEKLKDSDGKEIELKETDILNASSFATIENMVHDSKEGTLVLDKEKVEIETETDKKDTSTTKNSKSSTNSDKSTTKSTKSTSKTTKSSKSTTKSTKSTSKTTKSSKSDKTIKKNLNEKKDTDKTTNDSKSPIEREFKVVSGKNGSDDNDSSYPGMTFYTDKSYKMTKLTIPITKFQNCSDVKFYIWKRQEKNNKKNKVDPFKKQQLIWTSDKYSLKKAKVKGKYQYMDEGFLLDFTKDKKDGLTLEKGQYVIVAVPIPKSGTGSLFLKTYKVNNAKDFCIKYVGAANASSFHITETYQETWYGDSIAHLLEQDYYKKGMVESKTLTWTDSSLENIVSVKPIVGSNLTLGNKSKDSYDLYVHTGGDWIKVTPEEDNPVTGGNRTFKWKLVFKGNGKSTPKLAYNSKEGYAIKFILTREVAGKNINFEELEEEDKSMCITSTTFDGDEVLKEYIGDMNLQESRFEGYEFARVWADNKINKKILIDIQGSDKQGTYDSNNNQAIDLWSLHYCDLTLDDFAKVNVDYSDYEEEIEYDENNLRLKLDSNHSYNDNDIQILDLKDFTKISNVIDPDTESGLTEIENKTLKLVESDVAENQLCLKKTFENPIDLTKYTGLKFKFKIEPKESEKSAAMGLSGLGIYISTAEHSEDDVPSNNKNSPENLYNEEEDNNNTLSNISVLDPIIDPDTSSKSYYDGKIIKLNLETDPNNDGNKISGTNYYQYVKEFDEKQNKDVYKLRQIFDLKPYSIYDFGKIICSAENNIVEGRIEINKKSNNAKYVKEIGIITLNDEDKYKVTDESVQTKLTASCPEFGKLTIKLVQNTEEAPSVTGSGHIIYKDYVDPETMIQLTSDENSYTDSNVTGSGEIEYLFEGDAINDTTFSKSSVKINYDFEHNGVYGGFNDKTVEYTASKLVPTGVQVSDCTEITTAMTLEEDAENKKITVTLHKENDTSTVYKEREIKVNNNTITTDSTGKASFTLTSKGTINVIYNSEYKEEGTGNNATKTLYKGCGKTFEYDVRELNERFSIIEQTSLTPSQVNIELQSVKAISEEVLKLYEPSTEKFSLNFEAKAQGVTVYKPNNITLNDETYGSTFSDIHNTEPNTTQINIKRDNYNFNGQILCFLNNPFEGGLSNYKHIGFQFATDVYIPKDCLKLNICSGLNGENVIESINLPTMNSIYYPRNSQKKINLSQIFKKINDAEDIQIRSISISATNFFDQTTDRVVNSDKKAINLFVGKIVLYRAETIPFYHKKLRFKFYSTTNNRIDHYEKSSNLSNSITIRKIGTILDYH